MPYGEEPYINKSTGEEISGRYQILEKVGQGGMGTVYRVKDKLLDRELALKMLKPEELGIQEEKRFQREAATIAKLRHDNIIRLYDYGEYQGHPYFTMEYIQGKNLLELMRKKKRNIPGKYIAEIMIQIADAIYYAHDQGIIHRDIKPENIMINPEGKPVIMDFGLAKIEYAQTKLTHDGMMLGTLIYIAPEYISGEVKEVDPQNDIYAIGVILYEILAGRNPFYGRNHNEIMDKILAGNPPKPSKKNPRIPKGLETISMKAMAKKKIDRYQNAKELKHDLQRFLDGKDIIVKSTISLRFSFKDQKTIIYLLYALIFFFVFTIAWLLKNYI